MLMVERTVRAVYAHLLSSDVKMPAKGKAVYLCSPYEPDPVVIFWTDRKSDEGKRLFNCGRARKDGSQPPLFSD